MTRDLPSSACPSADSPPPTPKPLLCPAGRPPLGPLAAVLSEDWRAASLTGKEWWLMEPGPRVTCSLDEWIWYCWRTKSQRSRRTEHAMQGVAVRKRR